MTPPPPGGLDWRTPVGGGLAAAGIGAIISGVVLSNMAQNDWQQVLDSANNAPFPYGRTEEVLTAYRTANGKLQLGSVGIVGGVGLTAAGAGLLAWQFLLPHGGQSATPPSPKVACGVSAGGMRCSGSFSFP